MYKLIAILIILASSMTLIAQDEPVVVWQEDVLVSPEEPLDLVSYIRGRSGKGFYAFSGDYFMVNKDQITKRLGFGHISTAVVSVSATSTITIRAIE